MLSAVPFLLFSGNASEALDTYAAVFDDFELLTVERYGPEGPGPEGSVAQASFTVAGQEVACTDSFVEHEFGFTPAHSFFVRCESEAELDGLFGKLSDGGEVLMPLGEYPFARRFAWVADPFGVSWQLALEAE